MSAIIRNIATNCKTKYWEIMRKYNITSILIAVLCLSAEAQVSHGGRPLSNVMTRSYQHDLFEEMPAFDLDGELRAEDNAQAGGLRGGYRFAYKFMTDFNSDNSGASFTLPGGDRVWRLGIRSRGALSINVLFTEYELPEGAQVFLYNPSQTHILGAFNHLNNSPLGLLPVSPVSGDELIVEYIEPAGAAFRGRLTVGEVNHGYRSLTGYEPGGDRNEYLCMASPDCFGEDSEYAETGRSVVLLTIDGVTACTGVMVNNTLNDGKPYLLTASHCLNKDFSVANPDYEAVAGRIVCFFNYTSPTCDTLIRGTEEMSVSSAYYRAVNEKNDIALLELAEAPPAYYRPYYAGWTIEENGGAPPYAGIHHPRASVKRINIYDGNLALRTFNIPQTTFTSNAHWNVPLWNEGSTDAGSSGSPLFDASHRLTGYLSGGRSTCASPVDDYYGAFFKAWNPQADADAGKQLKIWLNPSNRERLTLDGLDPYDDNPAYRLSNIGSRKLQDSISSAELPAPGYGNVFGINSLKTEEYAEEYRIQGDVWIDGVYLVTPAAGYVPGSLDVEITLYEGSASPRTLLHAEAFNPAYRDMSIMDSTFADIPKRLDRAQESFVRFNQPVHVTSGAFYAGYKIKASGDNATFSVYNLSKGATAGNTAWVNNKGYWIQATAHPSAPFATSLFIDPVVRYGNDSSVEAAVRESASVWVDASRKQIYVQLPVAGDSGVCRIYTAAGQFLQENAVSGSEGVTVIPATQLSTGVYILQIKSKQSACTKKIFL
jgi:hypothetical protein